MFTAPGVSWPLDPLNRHTGNTLTYRIIGRFKKKRKYSHTVDYHAAVKNAKMMSWKQWGGRCD